MKRFYLFSLLSCMFLYSFGQTTHPSGVTGCIARYDFANSGNPITSLPDVSLNGNNSSSVTNLQTAAGFRNAPNKAMQFNGVNSWANVPNATNLNPSAITMVALVRFNGFYSGLCQASQIVSKGLDNTAGNYGIYAYDNAYDGSCSIYSPFNMQLSARYGTLSYTIPAGNYFQTNQWYFLVSSYDGSTVKYYHVPMDPGNYVGNIAPIYTGSVSGTIGTNTQSLTIGRLLSPMYPYWFYGGMDEVALFNKALSATEIQSVYDYLWGIVAVTSVSSTNLCTGQTFNVSYSVNNTSFFGATNAFTAQLSNATGSFATPTTIGSVSATGAGTIACTIPQSVASGSGYRIRIVASNVPYTTADNGTNITITNIAKPVAASNTPICVGQTLNLQGSSSTPGVSYSWTGPAGLSTNTQNPSINSVTNAHSGDYILVTTLNGCSRSDTETVAIGSNVLPTIVASISPDDTTCVGGTFAFSSYVSNGGANPQYQWMRNGVDIPGETNLYYVSKTLVSGDVINCKITTNGCNTINTVASNSFTVGVVPKQPVGVNIAANPSTAAGPWKMITFTANITNGGATPIIQWKRNGVDIAGANGSTWSTNSLNNNDIITVAVTSSSMCAEPMSATSQQVVVNINTSVDDIINGQVVALYPNPNGGSFSLKANNIKGEATIEIVNAIGQVVYNDTATPQNGTVAKDIQLNVANGVYMLRLKAGNEQKNIRFVIEK